MASNSFIEDLKGVLTFKDKSMQSVVKNKAYFNYAILIIALVSVARFLQQYQISKAAEELFGFGLDTSFMIKQAVFGFVMTFIMLFFLHMAAVKWFKGKNVELKGFVNIYAFISVPMLLMAVPSQLVGLVAGIWTIVLFFKMMNVVFGHGFGKSLLVIIAGGFVGAIVGGVLATALGLSGGYGGYGGEAEFNFEDADFDAMFEDIMEDIDMEMMEAGDHMEDAMVE
jgi:hypothetical protein